MCITACRTVSYPYLPPIVAAHVAELTSALLGEALRMPRGAARHSWRDALPDSRADFYMLNGTLPGLFFAGDYTAGQGRVHLAIEHGWQVARCIAAFAHERTG